jgi:hypothetical protein
VIGRWEMSPAGVVLFQSNALMPKTNIDIRLLSKNRPEQYT